MLNELRNPICWIRGLWLSFRYGANISGHAFFETENDGKRQVLKCEACGYKSIAYKGTQNE